MRPGQAVRFLTVVLAVIVLATAPASAGWLFGHDDDDAAESKEESGRRCCRFLPPEPPRGEAAVAIAARVRSDLLDENRSNAESGEPETADRIDALEEDLLRLTVIVEQLAGQVSRGAADLTQLTVTVESVAASQSKADQDLARLTRLVEQLANQQRGGADGN